MGIDADVVDSIIRMLGLEIVLLDLAKSHISIPRQSRGERRWLKEHSRTTN